MRGLSTGFVFFTNDVHRLGGPALAPPCGGLPGDFGFLPLIQVFDGPERYGASSFFETIPSRPSEDVCLSVNDTI